MSAASCKYCGERIEWVRNAAGKTIPANPDGTPHHRTCRAFHRAKAEAARREREARLAYGPARNPRDELVAENPNQLHFAF